MAFNICNDMVNQWIVRCLLFHIILHFSKCLHLHSKEERVPSLELHDGENIMTEKIKYGQLFQKQKILQGALADHLQFKKKSVKPRYKDTFWTEAYLNEHSVTDSCQIWLTAG